MDLRDFQNTNAVRNAEWPGMDKLGRIGRLLYLSNEMGNEVGEAQGAVKKYIRAQVGIGGSAGSLADVADELSDGLITLLNMADALGIDLSAAVVDKFNATSAKYALKTRARKDGSHYEAPV